MSVYESPRSRTPKDTLLEGFIKRLRTRNSYNEEGTPRSFRSTRSDYSNFVSNDSQEPSGEEMHSGEPLEKVTTKIQLAPVNPLNKLYCSLMSGLKNEMDFGLRVATILANSKEASWISDFKFIDILIDCVESYSCCCDDEEESEKSVKQINNGRVYCNIWKEEADNNSINRKCNCLKRFWSGLREDIRVMNLVFGSSEEEDEESGDWNMKSADEDDFDEEYLECILDVKKHEPRNHKRIYNLIKNVAEIVRNLSFNIAETSIPNVSDETSSSGYSYHFATLKLLKFLVLLISCKDQYYQNLGLDIASNVASHVAVNSDNPQYLTFLELINRYCVNSILSSNDINHTNRSLEIICKIVSRYSDEPNEYIATQLLDHELLQRLTELLTCQHDVSLVISSLELFHALSESYPKLLINESKYLIKILLMLLNCEASQYFTKCALARIKVIDDRPKQVELPKTIVLNQKSISSSSPASTQTDNESYVVSWLRSCFEVKHNSGPTLRLNEIYEDYVKECIRCDRKNVITAPNFAVLTKRCFPSITMNGPVIEGLSRRSQSTTPIKSGTGPGGLSSPILKAQLCAPPKAGSISPGPSGSINSSQANPTSTLIKNLLANKLRSSSNVGSSSPSAISISSITAGSVTVTPASTSSANSSTSTSSINSKSDTTTTIIPCTINNLNSTFTQPQKPQEPDPDPADLEASNKSKKTFANSSNQPHNKSNELNMLGNSVATSVITSVLSSTSQSSPTSTSISASIPSSSSTSNSASSVIVTSTMLPTSTINNAANSLSTSVTITPAITNASLLPTSSGGSVNTQQMIVTANQIPVTSSTNILQSQGSCITTGQALQSGPVLITASPQPGQTLQPNQPQQFLLVRTIVGNQQTGLVGVPAGGTPVRLILPPGFLTQQRSIHQPNTTVNGIASIPASVSQDSTVRNSVSTIIANSTKTPITAISNQAVVSQVNTAPVTTASSISSNNLSTNDILLKAVLGSGIVTESPPTSNSSPNNASAISRSSTVKSSPLLNVLLDKGKLPDFSSITSSANQTITTNSCVTSITSATTSATTVPFNSSVLTATPASTSASTTASALSNMTVSQSNKVYILTTKSSLPIKSIPNVQQPQQQQGGQINSQNVTTNMQQPVTVQSLSQPQPVFQKAPKTQIDQQLPSVINNTEITVVNNPPSTPIVNSSTNQNVTKIEATTTALSSSMSTTTIESMPTTATSTETSDSLDTSQSATLITPTLLVNDFLDEPSEPITKQTISKGGLSNGELSVDVDQIVNKIAPGATNDLSSINDICKTIDGATKLISKRPSEEEAELHAAKKLKPNTCINSFNTENSVEKDLIKKEPREEKSTTEEQIKTNGNLSTSSKDGIISAPPPATMMAPCKSTTMTDSATNTSPPTTINGVESTTNSISTITSKTKTASKPNAVNNKNLQFLCEWHECKKVFNRPSQVYWHVHKDHVDIYRNTSEKRSCKWGGPEGRGPGCLSTRPKLSLLTHLNDFHCNPNALQQAALRRESNSTVPPPIAPPAHPGYAANAAVLAIRRHAINYVETPKPPPVTSLTPVSTCIRLTSALILRNLAQNSNRLKSFLQTFEPYLSELCMSEGRDESRTIAQVLAVIMEKHERRKD